MARWRSFDDYEWRPRLDDSSPEVRRALTALGKKGVALEPIRVEGRKLARTFWGEAWCRNLESYSDFSNRLPRGRTYLRGGNVMHLLVEPGQVSALVRGTRVYTIGIHIAELSRARWKEITAACAGRIDSLVDLLEGKLSGPVMEIVTRKETGLFPSPREIQMSCSCPDWAGLCKHLAAVLYGIGARLDEEPSLLFRLRRVDASELVAEVASEGVAGLTTRGARRAVAFGGGAPPPAPPGARGVGSADLAAAGSRGAGGGSAASPKNALQLPAADLASLFGIELSDEAPPKPGAGRRRRGRLSS